MFADSSPAEIRSEPVKQEPAPADDKAAGRPATSAQPVTGRSPAVQAKRPPLAGKPEAKSAEITEEARQFISKNLDKDGMVSEKAPVLFVSGYGRTVALLKEDYAQDETIACFEGVASTVSAVARGVMPALILASVKDANDVVRLLSVLKVLREDLKRSQLKFIAISTLNNPGVMRAFHELGCHEYILEPISERSLRFKLDLQTRALTGERRRVRQREVDRREMAEAHARLEEAAKKERKENGEEEDARVTSKVRSIDAQKLGEDVWVFKNSQPVRRGGKWTIRMKGPDSSAGDWIRTGTTPEGAPQWRFLEKGTDPAEARKKRGWEWVGEKPVEERGEWKFTSEKPDLSFVEPDGKKIATKLAADGEDGLVVAKDSEVALRKLRIQEQQQAREREKKALAVEKDAATAGKERTVASGMGASGKAMAQAGGLQGGSAPGDAPESPGGLDFRDFAIESGEDKPKSYGNRLGEATEPAAKWRTASDGSRTKESPARGKHAVASREAAARVDQTDKQRGAEKNEFKDAYEQIFGEMPGPEAPRSAAAVPAAAPGPSERKLSFLEQMKQRSGETREGQSKKPGSGHEAGLEEKRARSGVRKLATDQKEENRPKAHMGEARAREYGNRIGSAPERKIGGRSEAKTERIDRSRWQGHDLTPDELRRSRFVKARQQRILGKDLLKPARTRQYRLSAALAMRGEKPQILAKRTVPAFGEKTLGSHASRNDLEKELASAKGMRNPAEDTTERTRGGSDPRQRSEGDPRGRRQEAPREEPGAEGGWSQHQIQEERKKRKWTARDSVPDETRQRDEGDKLVEIGVGAGSLRRKEAASRERFEYPADHFGSRNGAWEPCGKTESGEKLHVFVQAALRAGRLKDVTGLNTWWVFAGERPIFSPMNMVWVFLDRRPERVDGVAELPRSVRMHLLSILPKAPKAKEAPIDVSGEEREAPLEDEAPEETENAGEKRENAKEKRYEVSELDFRATEERGKAPVENQAKAPVAGPEDAKKEAKEEKPESEAEGKPDSAPTAEAPQPAIGLRERAERDYEVGDLDFGRSAQPRLAPSPSAPSGAAETSPAAPSEAPREQPATPATEAPPAPAEAEAPGEPKPASLAELATQGPINALPSAAMFAILSSEVLIGSRGDVTELLQYFRGTLSRGFPGVAVSVFHASELGQWPSMAAALASGAPSAVDEKDGKMLLAVAAGAGAERRLLGATLLTAQDSSADVAAAARYAQAVSPCLRGALLAPPRAAGTDKKAAA